MIFYPWNGEHWKDGIKGQRVLILGESHYHNCKYAPECQNATDDEEARHRGTTRRVVEWWKDNPHRSPLSHRLPALFELDKQTFWSHVAFYNYIQSFAGLAARCRPKSEQWFDPNSAIAFQEVLDKFEPDRILVLGKKLWENLPSEPALLGNAPVPEESLPVANNLGGTVKVNSCSYWYLSSSGKPALAMPIMHPAAVRFRTNDWIACVGDWLADRHMRAPSKVGSEVTYTESETLRIR